MVKKCFMFLVISASLSSCSIYKSQFDCKPQKGVGCESVSTVNELLNNEALDDFIESKALKKKCKSCGRKYKPQIQPPQENEKMVVYFNRYSDEKAEHAPHEVYIYHKRQE